MSDSSDEAMRSKIDEAVNATPEIDLTTSRIDEIVLSAMGYDGVLDDLYASAKRTRQSVEHGTHAHDDGPFLGCVGLLALVVAAVAAGGIFGRFGQSPGWTWMPPALSPVVAALVVLLAAASIRRPAGQGSTRLSTFALVLVVVAGGVTLFLPDVKPWERVSLVASMVVTAAAVVWMHVGRSRNAEAARDRDLAGLRARREARESLAEERARATQELEERLRREQVPFAELEMLWEHAAEGARRRGATSLERTPGPVGASKLATILDLPRDHRDDADELTEAAWEAKRQRS
ncbi:hypothetical protein J2S40_001364 [Nocardioides luteus]|uniref:Uncharacterized protein n=1 Tax=Nocardioides luteus TaxID=1844 RepID=A0ABQ5T234_9ACTN|nr:hypothetical protein [Nocardioides luteus]MDR7310306.1 hypothetical protein [Nocardioides luteus]GGR53580.1 hypothetical protein GCM10010197_19990 [Nocardioides luteus]GLJ69915.1 hypothetical protein GCM10017579_39510 [Nocardioides luteus]